MKKALFIGGTGTISAAISSRLPALGWELHLLNRGNHKEKLIPAEFSLEGAHFIQCDINDEEAVARLTKNQHYDVVADFIAFDTAAIERDYRLFHDKTSQYIFISSASAYQKPPSHHIINESTPLSNPFWQYSRDKIACEELLMKLYREKGFPVTIVRPSHTYDQRSIPLCIHGSHGSWQTVERILEGKPIVLSGDGSSLWTFTHSRDFAKGFTGLMANIHAIGEAVQITGDESLTWNQAIACIGLALGKEARIVYAPARLIIREGKSFGYDFYGPLLGDKACSAVFDNSKLKRLVPDFCALTRFDRGIGESVDWYMKHSALQRKDPDFDAFLNHLTQSSFSLDC